MVIRAGDIRQLTINNRSYDPAPESTWEIDLGGMTNEHKLNGNGTGHGTQKRKSARITGELSIDDERQDLEELQANMDSGVYVPVTMTLVSGKAYTGSLMPVGDLAKDTSAGTAKIEYNGEKLEQM